MYENLVAEVAKKNISNRKLAETLDCHENTIGNILKGKSRVSIEFAFKIRSAFFPDMTLEYLFEHTDTENNEVA